MNEFQVCWKLEETQHELPTRREGFGESHDGESSSKSVKQHVPHAATRAERQHKAYCDGEGKTLFDPVGILLLLGTAATTATTTTASAKAAAALPSSARMT